MDTLSEVQLERPHSNPIRRFTVGLWLLLLAGIFYYASSLTQDEINSLPLQIICLTAALAVVLFANGSSLLGGVSTVKLSSSLHIGWFLVIVAIGLRYFAHFALPPVQYTGFEELQTGGIALRILQDDFLPIEFRFTNGLAALGFHLNGYSLDALRLPFQVLGYGSILLVALTLRRMKIRWLPTLVAIFCMATLRWLVIGAGSADELFAGIFFETLLLYFLISSEVSPQNRVAWAGFAGITAGVLFYEYVSYKIVIIAALAWWITRALVSSKAAMRQRYGLAAIFFTLTTLMVAAPSIIEIVRNPLQSAFFDGFKRHLFYERPDTGTYIENSLRHLLQHTQAITGQFASAVSYFYRGPDDRTIPLLVGLLFTLSVIVAIIKPGRPIARFLALTVLITVVVVSVTTNNMNVGRLTPILPILILLLGLCMDQIFQWAETVKGRIFQRHLAFQLAVLPDGANPAGAASNPPSDRSVADSSTIGSTPTVASFQLHGDQLLRALLTVLSILLIVSIVTVNLTSVQAMGSDPLVLQEYNNSPYAICTHLGQLAEAGQTVYYYSLNGFACQYDDTRWLYKEGVDIRQMSNIPTLEDLTPGAVVLMGKKEGIPEDDLRRFVELAQTAASSHSLRNTADEQGRITLTSFCYQCTATPQ